ncbi:porin family protein [Bacteroidota bacterium]
MKRLSLILITIFIIVFSINAQSFISEKVRLGVVVDPFASWMSSDSRDAEYDGVRFGINGGLALDYYFQENYSIATGITINSTGGQLVFEEPITFNHSGIVDTLPEGVHLTYKLQYIEVPLTIKLSTKQIGYAKYFARIGFCPSLNIKATGDASALNIRDEKINEEMSLFNLSYYIGAGIEYQLAGNTSLLLTVFFKNGFIDLTKNYSGGFADKTSLKNMGISIGFMF